LKEDILFVARDLETLPKGTWLHFSQLPADTTEESFATFLHNCGFDVAAEHISIRKYFTNTGASATVCFTKEAIAALVNCAIDNDKFHGLPVVATTPRPRT
jgi:hypothetical protein